jgi:hypothetical protein
MSENIDNLESFFKTKIKENEEAAQKASKNDNLYIFNMYIQMCKLYRRCLNKIKKHKIQFKDEKENI